MSSQRTFTHSVPSAGGFCFSFCKTINCRRLFSRRDIAHNDLPHEPVASLRERRTGRGVRSSDQSSRCDQYLKHPVSGMMMRMVKRVLCMSP